MISFFWALDVALSQALEVTWLNRVWQSLLIKKNDSFWGNVKLNFEFLVEFIKYLLLLTYKQLELLIREQQLLVISVQLNTSCLHAHKNCFSPKTKGFF